MACIIARQRVLRYHSIQPDHLESFCATRHSSSPSTVALAHETSTRQSLRLIVAALLRRGDELLLVCQPGPDDAQPVWTLPGGVVQSGEALQTAVAREVREETGLIVGMSGQFLYTAQIIGRAPTLVLGFEMHDWLDEVRHNDPDGFIQTASFMPLRKAISKMEADTLRPRHEPIRAYLRGEVGAGTLWCYTAHDHRLRF